MYCRTLFVLLAGAFPLIPGFAFGQSLEQHAQETIEVEVPDVPDTGPRADLDAVAKAIVERTNAFRKKEGREPVVSDGALTATAKEFAQFMAKADKYGHTADGRQPSERAKEQKYDFCIVLENIAYAFDSRGFSDNKLTDGFVTGWEKSPGHRRNMLDMDVTETGVAVARSEKTGHYYAVQMFGRPASAAIAFGIANHSERAVEYTVGDQSFTLKPRYTRTHKLCRPAEVAFKGIGEGAGPTTFKPAVGDKYSLTTDGAKLQIKKE